MSQPQSRAWVALAVLACAAAARAQDARGRIMGKVSDASGASIPQAAVSAVNASTNVAVTARTNEGGDYEVPYLQPGMYSLAVSVPGFKSYERKNLEVRAGERLTIDVALDLGQVNESVTVSGQVSLLDVASANLGAVSDRRRIVDLPLSGRNALYVAQLAPGVLYTGAPNHPNFMAAQDVVSTVVVNGTRSGNTEYTIDGVPSMWGTSAAFTPPAETVAEVKVQTATYDASLGRVAGGGVNIVLKSGGNQLHGAAQWFHTNQHLQGLTLFTRQWLYNPSTGPVNDYKQQQANPLNLLNHYGATLSGPAVIPKLYDGHNRTFWMVGFEALSRPWKKLITPVTVPTVAQRSGDFSSLLKVGANYQIYDPATIAAAGGGRYSRQPFPGNVIPSNRLDKTAKGLLQYWPEPNSAGTADGLNNYTPQETQVNDQRNISAKVDHHFSDRHRIFARYNQSYNLYTDDQRSGTPQVNVADRYRHNNGAVFDDVFVISPRLLTDFRAGFTRFEQTYTPRMQGFDLTAAGFSPSLAAAIDPQSYQFPNLGVAGYLAIGGANSSVDVTNYLTVSNDLTWTKSSVTFRFGGEYRLYRNNSYRWGVEDPTLTFNSKWTNGPLDSAAASPIGQGLASFLLGLPSTGSATLNDSYADQSANYALYLQADWRLTRTLTINAGVRYDYDGPVTERFDRTVRGFDFAAVNPVAPQAIANYAQHPLPELPVSQFHVNGGLTFAGVNGQPRELWDASHSNLAPRIALAWQVRRGSVIRAGYGIFFVPQGVDRSTANQTGFSAATTLNPSLDNGVTFIASLYNPFPAGLNQPLGAGGGLSTNVGQSVGFFPAFQKSAYMQRWSAGIQQQLPKNIFLEATYLGSRGVRLAATRQYAALPAAYYSKSPVRDQQTIDYLSAQTPNPFYPLLPGTGLAGTTVARQQLLHPYPEFTGVTAPEPAGYSWYHSLQVQTERRFSNGFTAQFNWTWSRFMEATGFRNASDPLPEKIVSDLDRAHVIHLNGIYELPFGRGKRLLGGAHGVTRALAEGWQLQAVWQHNTGAPLGFGNALLTAPLEQIPLASGERAIAQWFNTSAFDRRSAAQLASNLISLSTRFSGVRAPGVDMWNMSVIKNFPIGEKAKLQFHFQALDAFNHTTLAAPNTGPTSSLFGVISAASNTQPRVLVFGLKLTF